MKREAYDVMECVWGPPPDEQEHAPPTEPFPPSFWAYMTGAALLGILVGGPGLAACVFAWLLP